MHMYGTWTWSKSYTQEYINAPNAAAQTSQLAIATSFYMKDATDTDVWTSEARVLLATLEGRTENWSWPVNMSAREY